MPVSTELNTIPIQRHNINHTLSMTIASNMLIKVTDCKQTFNMQYIVYYVDRFFQQFKRLHPNSLKKQIKTNTDVHTHVLSERSETADFFCTHAVTVQLINHAIQRLHKHLNMCFQVCMVYFISKMCLSKM